MEPKPNTHTRYIISFDFKLSDRELTQEEQDRINTAFITLGLHILQDWQILAVGQVEKVLNVRKRFIQVQKIDTRKNGNGGNP